MTMTLTEQFKKVWDIQLQH